MVQPEGTGSANYWLWAICVYLALALGTFVPVLRTLLKRVALNPGGPAFEESPNFSQKAKQILSQHYERLRGTLSYWKTQAEKYRAFHRYCLGWTVTAGVLVPLLTQAVGREPASKWFLTLVSVHGALLFGLAKGFRVEPNYKAFRSAESEFYDLYRHFLDDPADFGDGEEEQIETYFAQVELIRKVARVAELDNLPTVEDATLTSSVAKKPRRQKK